MRTGRWEGGFTLIELMIAVAIVGILATVANVSYQDSIRKARRSEAAAALIGLSSAMERYMAQNGSYTGAAVGTGGIYPSQVPISGGVAIYTLSITGLAATTYTLNATRTGPQVGDKCGNLTLASTGAQGIASAATGVTVRDCWRR